MTTIEIAIGELQKGDVVIDKGREVYTILEIALRDEDGQSAYVQWADGGRDGRFWDAEHLDQRIDVIR